MVVVVMVRRWLLILSFLFALGVSCWAQADMSSPAEGGITGVIVTEDGQPATGATPCTLMRSGDNTGIVCRRSAAADTQGRFAIEHLKPGTYQVFAINEAEGYSIDNQIPGQDVTISGNQLWPNLTVHMRSRGGILVGSITDKVTGKSIRAQIEYLVIDNDAGGGTQMADGNFQLVVPANSDVLVVAVAHGYRGWVYTDTASPSRPVLRLASGERKTMQIELEPLVSAPR
jgi:hypothetical protein